MKYTHLLLQSLQDFLRALLHLEQLVLHVVKSLRVRNIKTGYPGRRPDVGQTDLQKLGIEMETTQPVSHVIGFGAGVKGASTYWRDRVHVESTMLDDRSSCIMSGLVWEFGGSVREFRALQRNQ